MTHKDMVLDVLQSGRKITPLEALREFGCFRLPARIYDLKQEGYKIHSKIVRGAKYKVYWMDRKEV